MDVRVVRVRPAGRMRATGEIFLGTVETQTVLPDDATDQHRVTEVAFHDGARTKLHTHTTDQVLVITAGAGVVGTPRERHEVSAGDVVLIPAGEAHFHGARPGADMTHYSILGASQTALLE